MYESVVFANTPLESHLVVWLNIHYNRRHRFMSKGDNTLLRNRLPNPLQNILHSHKTKKNKTRLKHFKVCESALHLYINALENANQKTQNPSRFNKKGGIGTVRFRSGSAPGEHWHFGSKSLPPASLPNFRGGTFIFHPFKIQRKHHLNFSCASQSTSEENTASKDARRRAHPLRGMSRLVNA
jgi:hypothetical protein